MGLYFPIIERAKNSTSTTTPPPKTRVRWSADVYRALHTIRGRVSAGQQMRRGLGVKRKRGDCSPPLPQSRKQTVCRAFSRFTGRSRPRQSLARSFRGSRCAARPSVGLNRLRNANTGSNLAESRHDCRLLPRLSEVFHPPCVPCSSSSFHLPYRLRSVRLERLDNAFVTLRRCEVNQTRRDFRCGNFGNVEISRKHPEHNRACPVWARLH
jgi:hypothetical protein